MPVHQRKIKQVQFTLGNDPDDIAFECQLQNFTIANNTDDGDVIYTLCPDGESREESDDDYALELTFFADWRADGISDFLWDHDKEVIGVTLDHHPDIPGEHVRFTGQVRIKAPNVGGEARSTEMTEVTLPFIGKPLKTRPTPVGGA